MSRLKGCRLSEEFGVNLERLGFVPTIKWNKRERVFAMWVPDMFSVMRGMCGSRKIGRVKVYISESDLWRMINADKNAGGVDETWFSFTEEQGELDDDTYLGVSVVQYLFYLSIDVLRRTKKVRVSSYIHELLPRVPRGGRPRGSKNKVKELTEEEKERLAYLEGAHKKIVLNCVRHDWANEYVEMEQDLCRLKGKRVRGRSELIAEFGELRKKINNACE